MDCGNLCTICDQPLQNDVDSIVTVREKGLKTLIGKSEVKKDHKWHQWSGKSMMRFHDSCRKRYSVSSKPFIPPKKLEQHASTSHTSETDNIDDVMSDFDFADLCIICGDLLDRKHKRVIAMKQDYLKDRLLDVAERRNDEDGKKLMQNLQGISSSNDLRVSYHKKCYDKFIILPSKEPTTRMADAEVVTAFESVCTHLEESGDYQFSLSGLQDIMGKHALSNKVLFRKLKEKYGDDIFILQHRGRETTIFYKTFNVTQICSDWFCNEDSVGLLQKKTILTVAAEILRKEIVEYTYANDSYSPPSKFLNSVVSDIPPILTNFLGDLLLSEKSENHGENFIKRDFIAHSIVSILRPKSFISNLQLAVGTYIYRKTGSRLLIDMLSKLGVCSSYHSIQLHEASTIMDPSSINTDKTFVQFVYDNTDHNVSTLDGHETFHCLGGIAAHTPDYEVTFEGGSAKCKKMPSASTLASQKLIETVPYGRFNTSGLETVEFVGTDKLRLGNPPALSPTYAAYLWARCLEVPNLPSWRGFMEVVTSDTTFSMSHITCLPFINEPPSNLTTLNTSLHHSVAETRKLQQKTCFVTYDQPLYFKARSIVAQSSSGVLKDVVVRLGGFHLLMSYLGSIGYVMDGSGLEDLWGVAYAPASIKKMLSGHAFSRAMRAHILSFTAIGLVICRMIDVNEEYKAFIHDFFRNWTLEPPLMGDFDAKTAIKDMTAAFVNKTHLLEKNGPTSKLWIQYFHSVVVALQFMEAERIGNWELHLQSVEQMLPLFHAAGHFAYAKSAQMYLQDMAALETTMDPVEYDKFTKEGYFTIRRTDKAWSGVWSDMVIEQTLNRFFGTDLRHGRGVTPSVVARYLLAMPAAFNIMECLETYCGIKSMTSEQHVDLSRSRITRDDKDIQKLIFWLNEHDPFKTRSSITSLSTGIIGGNNINCHMAVEMGLQAMTLMIGRNADNISLSTAYKVKPLSIAKSGMTVNDSDIVTIDSSLLFQRISVIFHGNAELTRNALTYELSPHPQSLFDDNGLMRKTAKSDLYKIFEPFFQSEGLLRGCTYVIDGGWLLHHVTWPHSKTFNAIFGIYLAYIMKNYGANATVVFDGYSNEIIGTKSYERYRRRERTLAADVDIKEDNLVTLSQSKFLSNVANKFKFVKLLSSYLEKQNIKTQIASEDADALIVRAAINIKENTEAPVAVIGNDVDLLVLLVGLTPEIPSVYFHKMSPGKKGNVLYSTWNHKHLKPFILFAHAFAGCDSTSAFYKKGKKTIISLLKNKRILQELAAQFYVPNNDIGTIYAAAEQFIFHLYNVGGLPNQSIGELRNKIFTSSVMTSKKEFSLASLPPTESALREHAKRVYFQVQQWLGHELNPEEWGWKRTNTLLLPVMTTKEPAPKELLEKVFCGCKTDCGTIRCGCRKAGLRCSITCKNCNGNSCENSSVRRARTSEDEAEDEVEPGDEEDLPDEIDERVQEALQCTSEDTESMEIDYSNY